MNKIKKFCKWLVNFGPLFALKASYNTIMRGKYDYDGLNHILYEKYLHCHLFRKITEKYKKDISEENKVTLPKFPIWVCWFQGGGLFLS